MIRSNRLKVLGLFGLVLGLMALSASAAQAEKGANWDVNGTAISSTLLPQLQVKEIEKLKGTEEKHLVLLTEIAKVKVQILCAVAELENFVLKTEGGSLGKIRFDKCEIFLNGVLSKACEPHTLAEKGVILTRLLKDLIVLHLVTPNGELKILDLLAPDEVTEPETFVNIELSETCAIGETLPVKGEFFIKDCEDHFNVAQVDHLIEEGPLTHLYVITDTVEHASKIDGSAILALTGAHKGLTWAGLPSPTKL